MRTDGRLPASVLAVLMAVALATAGPVTARADPTPPSKQPSAAPSDPAHWRRTPAPTSSPSPSSPAPTPTPTSPTPPTPSATPGQPGTPTPTVKPSPTPSAKPSAPSSTNQRGDGPGRGRPPQERTINDPKAPKGRDVGELKPRNSLSAIRASASPGEMDLGASATISGRLADRTGAALPRRTIYIYNADTEALVASTVTDGGGSFTAAVRPAWLGTQVYNVYYRGDGDAGWALDTVRIEALARFALTAAANPGTVHAEERVQVSGQLTARNGTPVPGANVGLIIDPSGQSSARAVTDAQGQWSATFTVPADIWTWNDAVISYPEYWISAIYDATPANGADQPIESAIVLTLERGTAAPTPSATPSASAPTTAPIEPTSTTGLAVGQGVRLLVVLLGLAGIGLAILLGRRRG